MPDPDFCDFTVVLDRSGSMHSVASDTVGGFNRFVEDQKAAPGRAVLTLVQFDTEYEFVHRAVPVGQVPPLDFHPRGGTALLDALGRAIVETGERLAAMPEDARPGKIAFVVLTDGQENSSREYTRERVFEMIRRQNEEYSWQFLFLGANQDAISAASSIGIPAAAAMTYAGTGQGTARAMNSASSALRSYRCGPRGQSVSFTDEDRAVQADLSR
jgi:hypothetical protein